MTEEQKERFRKKFNGWCPTEKQFQWGKKHPACKLEKEMTYKILEYRLLRGYDLKTDILPLLEDLKVFLKIEKENRELYAD